MNLALPGQGKASVVDLAPDRESLRSAVLAGLAARPRRLPAWLFYDARGSRLFERICRQPEYYPTRTELAILRRNGAGIAAVLGAGCQMLELGAGAPRKARLLLSVLRSPAGYVAIDVSGTQLRATTAALARAFPSLPVAGVVADYHASGTLPLPDPGASRPLAFFPGSTIGNMDPRQARAFLEGWRPRLLGGGMLVGVDLVKDKAVLDAAYDDAAGVTAAFNRNMLVRINRELGADFDPAGFRHRAFFDPRRRRVEMHLVSTRDQAVRVCGRRFRFAAGASIRTEISCKYSVGGFQALARRAGFRPAGCWTDQRHWFAIHWLEAPEA